MGTAIILCLVGIALIGFGFFSIIFERAYVGLRHAPKVIDGKNAKIIGIANVLGGIILSGTGVFSLFLRIPVNFIVLLCACGVGIPFIANFVGALVSNSSS